LSERLFGAWSRAWLRQRRRLSPGVLLEPRIFLGPF